ncbi:hypothetical protein EYZ11_005459 [Aspergillus tanneri]|uniref:CBM21 domain-containing protein n=1 Tax=Aspergillus tanneri TaxID=1220188 RepID=A0A4V3UPM9_9EURO|nr:uncharacterized protein ATNIH1004_008290 [Aspergillus tanneri]KAA8644092.1 hypothetical protein ATNIH1004_008290 [Aspergillus tanneri]THC95064.1 hypothetical protein EYZ11_005459 [Aspergillus tanneri]
MPYTAPSKPSLSAQHIDEHCSQFSQSCPNSPPFSGAQASRPHLSRFYTSTTYLRRHRRSSSNSKTFAIPGSENSVQPNHAIDYHASIRQSPPPISGALIPPGALISPPESAPNSSDEEPEAAVSSIQQRRVSSPERQSSEEKSSPRTAPFSCLTLSKEACEISHSRSFTANAITQRQEEALTSSPEESDRDDELLAKQPMVRKKSGELVRPALRPSSARRRPSSMPGTPTYSKAVHFDSQLEHIRHFLQLDKPQAVSAETSPVEDFSREGEFPFKMEGSEEPSFEWDISLSNFPKDLSSRGHRRVRLEHISLSLDKSTLVGVVGAANLAFQKHVAARFTFDNWKTISEVNAEYGTTSDRKQKYDGYDRFTFSIKLDDQAHLERKTMFICIRYSVGGSEYWDNNDSKNFQVNFMRKPKQQLSTHRQSPDSTLGSRPSLPRSRTFTHSVGRPQSMPSSFDDLSSLSDSLSFVHPSKDTAGQALCRNASHDLENGPPVRRERQPHQMFGNRYDFGASLSAVMRTKPEHDRTTLTARAKSETSSANTANHSQPEEQDSNALRDILAEERNIQPDKTESAKPSSLIFGKPHRESSVYKELVDRYCFYGSAAQSTAHGTWVSENIDSRASKDFNSSSKQPSPASSPALSPRMDSSARNPPSTPHALGYPHHQPVPNNFLNETKTPTAIRG